MKYYLIKSKSDDYGACVTYVVLCNKEDLKRVYDYQEV